MLFLMRVLGRIRPPFPTRRKNEVCDASNSSEVEQHKRQVLYYPQVLYHPQTSSTKLRYGKHQKSNWSAVGLWFSNPAERGVLASVF